MDLTHEFKNKVLQAMLEDRKTFGGTDTAYAKTLGINSSAFSRLKGGETERILSDSSWLTIGNILQVTMRENTWKVARTKVYTEIEDNLQECKNKSQSMILVDDCGIGKTFCARHIVRRMKNSFYIDCSQAKTRIQFVKFLARTLGVDDKGKHIEVKSNIKYALNILDTPLIVLDEAGDLDYSTLLILKELWNSSEGNVGWYMMGADGLRSKMKKGINNHKVGFAELFSRFSEKFITLTPQGVDDRRNFYAQLIGDVAVANTKGANINTLIRKTYDKLENRHRSLRHLKTLIQIS
ncbi:MAG: ATP-binding protein [Leeuwenhoekiella sp.]